MIITTIDSVSIMATVIGIKTFRVGTRAATVSPLLGRRVRSTAQ
jgi:hypothetical protein